MAEWKKRDAITFFEPARNSRNSRNTHCLVFSVLFLLFLLFLGLFSYVRV